MNSTTLLTFALFANTLVRFVSANDAEPVAHLGKSQQTTHLVNKLHRLHDQLLLVSTLPWVLEKEVFHELEVLSTLGKLVYALGETHAHEKLLAELHTHHSQVQGDATSQHNVEQATSTLEAWNAKKEHLLQKLFELLLGDVTKLHHFFSLVFDTAFLEGLKQDWQSDVTKLKELLNLLGEAFNVVGLLQNSHSEHTAADFPVFKDFLDHVKNLGLLLDLGVELDFLLHKNDQQKKLADELVKALHDNPTWAAFQVWLEAGHNTTFSLLVGWEGVSSLFDGLEGLELEDLGDLGFVNKLVTDGLEKRRKEVLDLFKSKLNHDESATDE